MTYSFDALLWDCEILEGRQADPEQTDAKGQFFSQQLLSDLVGETSPIQLTHGKNLVGGRDVLFHRMGPCLV
jgi:hypothetical protein